MLYSGTDPESYITEYTLLQHTQNIRMPKWTRATAPRPGAVQVTSSQD